MNFSFIHTADIHLGREFSDTSMYSTNSLAKNLYEKGIEKVLDKIVNLAIDKNVDFVLIAGDTFDSENQDFKSKLILTKALKKLDNANIKVILICGNHDPLKSYNRTIFNFDTNSNIKIVGLNTDICTNEIIYKDNNPIAIVHALSFETDQFYDNPTKKLPILSLKDKDLFNIGLLHCDLNGPTNSPYAPCSETDLKSLNYDYWALGHIHIPSDSSSDNIFYAGTCQGRNTKECGSHGIRYVEVENNNIKSNQLIPTDIIRYEKIYIDISKAENSMEIVDFIDDAAKQYINNICDFYLIKIILTGHTKFYSELNDKLYNDIAESINSSYIDKIQIIGIENNTEPAVNHKVLENDSGIVGEIYKTAIEGDICEQIFNDTLRKYDKLLSDCYFDEEELNNFKTEIIEYSKQQCIDICNQVYNVQNKEES